MATDTCSVVTPTGPCLRRRHASGNGSRSPFCAAHKYRLYKHGDVRAHIPIGRANNIEGDTCRVVLPDGTTCPKLRARRTPAILYAAAT